MDKFYIRFCLQRMQGAVEENFPYECIMDASAEEISSFINECDEWQGRQADEICASMKLGELKGKRVLFVGDSITADRMSYRGIVTKAAQLVEYNAAISGAVSTDMFRHLKQYIQNFNPDIISIMIGSNDSLIIADKKNLVSKREYEDNIEKIIHISKESGAKVMISTIQPVDEKRFNSPNKTNNNANITDYCNIIRNQAMKNNISLNDFADAIKDESIKKLIENDGVHLTPYGQSCLAKQWLNTIIETNN